MERNLPSLGQSITHHIGGQLVSRLISFIINIYLFRCVDGSLLGVVNVGLSLFYTTSIFLIREPFRKTFLSNSGSQSSLINHLWLAPIISPLITTLLYVCFWLPLTTIPPLDLVPSYSFALFCFGFSSWLESLSEPFVIISLRNGMDSQYAALQGMLVASQRLIVFALILLTNLAHIDIFCYAQVLSSFIYLIACAFLVIRLQRLEGTPVQHLFPSKSNLSLSTENLSNLCTFFAHSVFKQILTDGSNYVLTFTDYFALSTKASYDAIEKLGSLIARTVFAPLEHSAYLYFSSRLRREKPTNNNDFILKEAVDAFLDLLHITTVIGFIISVFAIPYSTLAVTIYGGDLLVKNSGAGLLKVYAMYVIILAINGITECFAMASMNNSQIFSHGSFLLISSPLHILVSILLSYFIGAYGLILANIINMIMRIIYSCSHINSYLYKPANWLNVFPSFSTVICLGFSLVISLLSLTIFGGTGGIIHNAAHVAVGGALFLFVLNHLYNDDIHIMRFLNQNFNFLHPNVR